MRNKSIFLKVPWPLQRNDSNIWVWPRNLCFGHMRWGSAVLLFCCSALLTVLISVHASWKCSLYNHYFQFGAYFRCSCSCSLNICWHLNFHQRIRNKAYFFPHRPLAIGHLMPFDAISYFLCAPFGSSYPQFKIEVNDLHLNAPKQLVTTIHVKHQKVAPLRTD